MTGYKVAVVGATGNVGREMLSILAERQFPASEVVALASAASEGKQVSYGEKETLTVRNLETYDFTGTDIGLFSPGASVSKIYAPKAADQGCIVIDNTSFFRMHDDIPLVVPEVNPGALKLLDKTNIIANPNCSTIQMVVALKPLHDAFNLKRIVVSTYQSVSGAGKEAMDELYEQTKRIYAYDHVPPQKFTKRIAFNVIPHIDVFLDDGSTKEEWKMVVETRKILCPDVEVSATCVRVPVFTGHAESINAEFEGPITAKEAKRLLRDAPGVNLIDEDEHGDPRYITPIECAREDAVFVSRVRQDKSRPNTINMWVTADNLRKGAALNSVQIAELVAKDYLA